MLSEPLPEAARRRVRKYLERIRELAVRKIQSRNAPAEEPLWSILSTCLNSRGPLLPKIQSLEISSIFCADNQYLQLFLSPSIKVLELVNCDASSPKLNGVTTTLKCVKASGCDLHAFKCGGDPIPDAPEALMIFKNLQSVEFPLIPIPKQKSSVTITQFLASLPYLRSLTCRTAAFLRSKDEDRVCHTSLQKIRIRSKPTAFRELFRRCTFPSVTNVDIQFDKFKNPSMDSIVSSCPEICQLEIFVNRNDVGCQILEFKHVAALLSLPIQSFTLHVQKCTLTPSDLCKFAKSWPDLRSFRLCSVLTMLNTVPPLAAFLGHPRLNTLHLILPCCHLLDDIPKMQNLIKTARDVPARGGNPPPLHTLNFINYNRLRPPQTPRTTAEKHVIVEYLLQEFPSLQKLRLWTYGRSSTDDAAEYEKILKELRKERE